LYALLFTTFMLLPLGIIMITSFTGDNFVSFPPGSYGLRWYAAAFANDSFTNGLIFSLQIAVLVAIASGIMGVAAALALFRQPFAGQSVVVSLLTMPIALPHIVIAIAILQLVGTLAIPSSPYGLVAGHLLITMPFVLRLTMTSLQGLDQKIQWASYSLGATWWQTVRFVILPMVAPGVAAGVVFAMLLSFDEVTISLFTGLPGRTTLPAEIFSFASQGSDPIVTAVSGWMIIISAVLVVVAEKFFGVLRLIANEKQGLS
jgi:putative spermidine/putrescine transport system permease protein